MASGAMRVKTSAFQVVVVPSPLQGHEVLLGAGQEALAVEPFRLAGDTRTADRTAGRERHRLRGMFLALGSVTVTGIGMGVPSPCRQEAEGDEQHHGDQ